MRLFVALQVPDGVRKDVERALDGVRAAAPPELRWADPARWHLTLAFLGEVAVGRLDELETRLARAAARHAAPSLQVAGAGRFGGGVLWAGIRVEGAGPAALRALAGSVSAAARRVGVPQDEQAYRPHLTLARAARPVDLRPLVAMLSGLGSRTWTADAVHLVRSRPGPRPEHTSLRAFPLAPAAGRGEAAAPRMPIMDEEQIRAELARLERERPDVYAILLDDPTTGLPPTEDLIETGLFSQLEDGLLYLPQGAQEWVRDHTA